MKYIKKFENAHDDLIDKLQNNIINDNKIINGFSADYEMSGAIEWTGYDYVIYATPYWEGEKILPINIMNTDGDEIDYKNIKLSKLKNEDDIKEFLIFYYKNIEEITSLLNKRTELKNVIKILLNSVGNIFLKSYKLNIGDIDPDQIPNSDISNLLELFNTEYPHIIQSNKFNL